VSSANAYKKPIEKNYFASLRADKVNVRAGPGSQYPIKFTFKLRGLPVKIISEYDNWSEIKDFEGEMGWINQNLITKKRTILVTTKNKLTNIYAKPSNKSKTLLKLENKVVADFLKCIGQYCAIKISGEKGWVDKEEIWGIDNNDLINN
jgi:SH3-like domain-containing protein